VFTLLSSSLRLPQGACTQEIAKEHLNVNYACHDQLDSTPPKIPRQLLSDMDITREEEKALKIIEEATDAWRAEHDIPGTDSLLEMMQADEMQKRERSDTVSTYFSVSHDQKKARIYSIPK
jgi:hypothetical protein